MVATNVELARTGFEAFERGGPEGLVALAHPEIEVYAEAELGNPGTYRGPEAFLRWQEDWLEAWGEFNVEPREFVQVGESVVVVPVRQTAIGRGSGVPVELDTVVFLFEFREQMLRRFHLYAGLDRALEAARRIAAGQL